MKQCNHISRRQGFVLTGIAMALAGVFGLTDQAPAMGPGNGPGNGGSASGLIDFEGLAEGMIVDQLSSGSGLSGGVSGFVGVHGNNSAHAGNTAMVFDTDCPPNFTTADCSGGDPDLGTPNEMFLVVRGAGPAIPGPGVGAGGASNTQPLGKVLILSEDLDSSDPDDADRLGMYVDFDFTTIDGPVTVNSVRMLDIEEEQGEDGTFLDFYTNGSLVVTDMIAIPPTGDNGEVTIAGINLANVDKMRVNFNGSGATASVAFNAPEDGLCWSTSGGFQNAGFQSGSKDYTFGGNVGPPPSGVWEVVDHNSGDNFHSNDVEVVSCGVIVDVTGPKQPGGKKGLKENLLNFEGTGRLRDGASGVLTQNHPHRGCVIDAGEPAGKKDLDQDYFEIVVCASGLGSCSYGTGLCSESTQAGDLDPTAPQDACDDLVQNNGDVVFAACGSLDGGNFQIHPPTGKTN